MPGDYLLFHCLSSSTIGAVGFHGRVRDGIGWDTDAMATRQRSRCGMALIKTIRKAVLKSMRTHSLWRRPDHQTNTDKPKAVIDGGTLKRE